MIPSKVFTQLCPNVVEDPAAVIPSIHQVTKDAQGGTMSIHSHGRKLFHVSPMYDQQFPPQRDYGDWAIDVTPRYQF
jgi:hypothetical protein